MRRNIASSKSCGRLVARKHTPSKRSISVRSSVISEEPPWLRLAKSDSHSSKKTTAPCSSASRKIDCAVDAAVLVDWASTGKLTSSTFLPICRATALAVIVLPLPLGPQSSSTSPSGCGMSLERPTRLVYALSCPWLVSIRSNLVRTASGSTTSPSSTLGE